MVGKMYLTLLTTIFAGIANSLFCKSEFLSGLKKPLDFDRNFLDGKRIFGDNKTIKGFLGYILFNILFSVALGWIYKMTNLSSYNFFYGYHDNTVLFNILIGFLLGLFYALFELPNSFIKRRFDISPGKSINGPLKVLFVFLDQADSIFGVALVVWMFYPLGFHIYLFYILLGAGTHIIINTLLYLFHVRKNMF